MTRSCIKQRVSSFGHRKAMWQSRFIPLSTIMCVILLSFETIATSAQHFTLQSAYEALGFDPHASSNKVVVLFSDPHMNLDFHILPVTTNLDPRLVGVINGMDPPPAKIIVSGDTATTLSPIPGWEPRSWNMNWGTNEMIDWLNSIKILTNINKTNILWVPGNHDQLYFETNAETYRLMYPTMPTRQRVDVGGVRFLLINCGAYGGKDEAQDQWLREEVAMTSPEQPVAVVTHVPPFLIPPIYRWTGVTLREVFQDWPERWWVFSGHYHARSMNVYDIGLSNVTQMAVGAANPTVFNGASDDTGCLFLCLSNGISGMVYYHYNDQSFEVVPSPNWASPRHFTAGFEGVSGLLWRRLKSREPAPEVKGFIGHDGVDWFSYARDIRWNLPLNNHSNQATHFLLFLNGLDPSARVEFSTGHNPWVEVEFPSPENSVYSIPIPPHMRSLPVVYARFSSDRGNNFIGGWGLSTTNTGPRVQYPQLQSVDNFNTSVGRTLLITNQAFSPYSPPDRLKFSLSTSPQDAVINPDSGVFSWTPPPTAEGNSYLVEITAADEGTPIMSDTVQFQVFVDPPEPPSISIGEIDNGALPLSVSGYVGMAVTVQSSTNFVDWTTVLSTNLMQDEIIIQIVVDATNPQEFYRAIVTP